jgi:hypothetical protein
MPISQNPLFEVSTNRVDVASFNGSMTLGADLVITGGSGTYTYRWYNGDNTLSTESTLNITSAGQYMLDIDDSCNCRQTITFNIGDTGVSSIEAASLKVYPNPTKGIIYIEGTEIDQVSVVNMSGALVKVVTSPNYLPLTEIDLSELPTGTYILTLANENGTVVSTRKIIRN